MAYTNIARIELVAQALNLRLKELNNHVSNAWISHGLVRDHLHELLVLHNQWTQKIFEEKKYGSGAWLSYNEHDQD